MKTVQIDAYAREGIGFMNGGTKNYRFLPAHAIIFSGEPN
jgi:hypothetical protein